MNRFSGKIPALAALCLTALLLGGCSRASVSRVDDLEKAIGELTIQVNRLEARVAALEAAATPVPTATPKPSASSGPTATPEGARHPLAADEICSLLLKSGMPVSYFTPYTADDDPDGLLGTEGGYASRADFKDANVADVLGIVEVYENSTKAGLRASSLQNEIRAHQRQDEFICRYDNVIMRLPYPFTKEQGYAYEEVLRKILGLIG